MHSPKIKICGMRDVENIRQVATLDPDYMGFIFYARSKRAIPPHFRIPDEVKASRVGVFVNESTERMLNLTREHQLDYLQLHGTETLDQCKELKDAGVGIIKVFSIGPEFDFGHTQPYQSTANFFLFDTAGEGYGGTGKTFNWRLLRKYNQETPFFLSGGLNPQNVSSLEELKGMNLHALDLNSGVESGPGVKQVGLIEEVLAKVTVMN